MSKLVSLDNGRNWSTRGAAIDHFRSLRDSYPVGSTITDPTDRDDLMALVRRYDGSTFEGPGKIGVGVERFETRTNLTNGGRTIGFWIIRLDGTETDFSFIRAVNEAPKRDLEQLSDACRASVAADMQTARIRHYADHADDAGCVPCCLTGDPVTEEDSGFRYIGQGFMELVCAFARSKGWGESVPNGVLTAPADAQTTTAFADSSAATAFRAFHRSFARIQICAKRAARREAAKVREHGAWVEL